MHIAFSGTHYSGKSTLIHALLAEMPGYEAFEEPYWILTELGRPFSDPPTIEEFEEQLEYSIKLIEESPQRALFDRSPIDFLGYALVIAEENSEEFDTEKWESRIERVLPLLDLIVFLPLENPDRIPIPDSEEKYFRELVDKKLRDLIIEDTHGIMNRKVLEVTGTVSERVKKMKQYLQSLSSNKS